MFRVLIVEDEETEARRLSELIHQYGKLHGRQFKVTWIASAIDMLSDKVHYDLCFLDIELPGINGMEAAELLRVQDPLVPIIFVTNLAKYAVRGYEVGATGFIVKPATLGGLTMTLDRALRAIEQTQQRSVVVPTDEGLRVIPFASVISIEVTGHKLTFKLDDGVAVEARGVLGQVEEDLADAPIVRVSKNCLANMDKVALIRTNALQMVNGEQLHISRTRKREVVDTVTDYLGGRR